ncbi:zinc-binding dehydrogenase [Natronoglycomyces albus]|uniref:Zinc-binding dehydrogenase n=1 Tax=Natronoglycomyces albus TaxID=2811108 RepID=A0A895XLK8_9ACTN|nr:zinc-binding dehydrogenase [Natronoglycomyces albus]QSB04433.1 zinc-binding dehydrogenase [Natronoglycomyces albus]
MLAAFARTTCPDNPFSALSVAQIDPPPVPEDWVRVQVKAAALNHHDLWSLAGVGLGSDQCPMILGCDAAGITDEGREVIVHSVIGDHAAGDGDETMDPQRTLLSEKYPGTLAEYVWAPKRNLVGKPPAMTFAQAACIPAAYLTAWRMLTTRGRLPARDGTVLVQGAGGGVASAAIVLARALGATVYVTSRTAARRARALQIGATRAFEPGAHLPRRVDVVVDSVAGEGLNHSINCAKPGGRVVLCGVTGGHRAQVDLRRLFFHQIELIGSTMGTLEELSQLLDFCERNGVEPIIDSCFSLGETESALRHLQSGKAFGKVVVEP